MTRWLSIRAKAFQVTRDIRARLGDGLRGTELLDEIINEQKILLVPVPANDPLLGEEGNYCQATYEPQYRTITVNQDAEPQDYILYVGHELGHHFLHRRGDFCRAESVSPENVGLTVPYGEGRVATYSQLQQQEIEANIFAAELLMPSQELCQKFDSGDDVDTLAAYYGVSKHSILAQLANAALEPPINFAQILADDAEEPFHWRELDDSQKEAACIPEGPVHVDAGPGTGKTRTLIGRIEWLIENHTLPDSIIVLTFSNKATDEVRRRLRQVLPEQVHQVSVTTFHGFGVELLRRFGSYVGRDPGFSVLDPVDAQELLVNNLDKLDLRFYADLVHPGKYLDDDSILGFISQLKQALISPEQFDVYLNDPNIEFAEEELAKYREISFVYHQYEQLKRTANVVDYDDLVMLPVLIFRDNPDALEGIQNQYSQILVDEFQDINPANGELIHLLSGNGNGLWAVGDLRQSIYRWRGASPKYLEQFSTYFPNAKPIRYLNINYRSMAPLVTYFAKSASQLGLMNETANWEASRFGAEEINVFLAQASDRQNEEQGVIDSIRELTTQKQYSYADCAILCRTHRIAAQFAKALQQAGIPVMHFGNFYEREEIKDLLAVIDLTINRRGVSWMRVATLLSTPIIWDQALDFWKQIQSSDLSFPDALRIISLSDHLSSEQSAELNHFAQILSPYQYTLVANPWLILVEFLFSYGHYIRRLRSDFSNNSPKLLAIGHLLQLTRVHSLRKPFNAEQSKAEAFLNCIRTLVGREDADTPTPSLTEGINAVNILTIHKAKGLEFPVVFIPRVDADAFRSTRGGRHFMAPPAELAPSLSSDDKEQEEKSTLFVAMSRARDYLFLSYASKQDNGNNRNPSKLWSFLQHSDVQKILWKDLTAPATTNGGLDEARLPEISQVLDRSALRRIQYCPRQFYYQDLQKLIASVKIDMYPQFYRALSETMDVVLQTMSAGQTVELESMTADFLQRFRGLLPAEHIHRNWYEEKGKQQIAAFLSGVTSRQMKGDVQYHVPVTGEIGGLAVAITVDEIIITKEGSEAFHHRIGRSQSGRLPMHLYREILSNDPKHSRLKLITHSLLDDVEQESSISDEKPTAKELQTNLQRLRDGDFGPNPRNKWACATCPFYFICAI